MKLHQLQYFREVCAQNGITKAAETLHISQPAVSNAIKELEEEFHVFVGEYHAGDHGDHRNQHQNPADQIHLAVKKVEKVEEKSGPVPGKRGFSLVDRLEPGQEELGVGPDKHR